MAIFGNLILPSRIVCQLDLSICCTTTFILVTQRDWSLLSCRIFPPPGFPLSALLLCAYYLSIFDYLYVHCPPNIFHIRMCSVHSPITYFSGFVCPLFCCIFSTTRVVCLLSCCIFSQAKVVSPLSCCIFSSARFVGPLSCCIFSKAIIVCLLSCCILGWSVEIFFDRTEQGN